VSAGDLVNWREHLFCTNTPTHGSGQPLGLSGRVASEKGATIRPIFNRAFFCLVLLTVYPSAMADVLIATNGEQFIGKVLEETSDSVTFLSETGGRFTVPRQRIRQLQRMTPVQNEATNRVFSSSASTNASWRPPGVGKDGFDWLKLKSDEWLKGHLDYVQEKKVQFDSDKLEDLSLELKDVREIYSAKPMFIRFHGREQLYGTVAVTSNLVTVVGPEQIQLPREQLTGITPGGKRELDLWSGKVNLGLNLQSGNTKQVTFNASGELARRTPATEFLLTYLGNFGKVDETQNANNHRINVSYDVRLNRDWFVRPIQMEYYRDQLANIAHRATVGVGFGYYLFDRDNLEWKVAAGPGYQYTRFETVVPGDESSSSTPAGMVQTFFKTDITRRLTFTETFTATLASQQAGLYTHHMVSSLEFEIKHFLDLDLSFVWDYLQNPQTEANGTVPVNSDLRLTLGLGVKF